MKNILNEKVIHKNFGMGSIVEIIDNERILVKFESLSELKKFKFPDAFKDFVKFKNTSLQEESMTLLEEKKKIETIEKEQSRIEHEKEFEEYRKEQLEIQKSMRKRPNTVRKVKKI